MIFAFLHIYLFIYALVFFLYLCTQENLIIIRDKWNKKKRERIGQKSSRDKYDNKIKSKE